jgi:dolichol-phosphate mannosyltransferase
MITVSVIFPIFNEEESIRHTIEEWLREFSKYNNYNFSILLINDGSTDNTAEIIEKIKNEFNNINCVHNTNKGHGQSCLFGYKYSADNNFDYILQLDSDGQCDPKYFHKFIEKIESSATVVYGIRYYRKDGFLRFLISRIVSIVGLIVANIWVWDPNVPYRMFKTTTVTRFLSLPLTDFFLVNILLGLYHKKMSIKYVPIVFRDRWGGSPSVNTQSMLKYGKKFISQLRIIKNEINN